MRRTIIPKRARRASRRARTKEHDGLADVLRRTFIPTATHPIPGLLAREAPERSEA